MSEDTVKVTVEQIIMHYLESERQSEREYYPDAQYEQREGERLEKQLEAQGVTLVDDEENIECIHIHKNGVAWLDLDISGEWQWTESEQPL